jgi:hypothetical protein
MDDKTQQLAWEAKWRLPAVVSSIVAGLILFGAAMLLELAIAPKDPAVGLIQALQPALHGQAQAVQDPHTARVLFINSKAPLLLLSGIATALATMLTAGILVYLSVAVRNRADRGALATSLAISGPVLFGLAQIAGLIIEVSDANKFAHSSDHSHTAVVNALSSSPHVVAGSIALAGGFALLIAFILVCRGAMQVGLLTRFLGWFGVAAGVFFMLPLFPLPIVQTGWLVAVGVFLSGWGGQALPEAWITGEAKPLPTAAELREKRELERSGRSNGKATPAPAPVAPGVPSAGAGPARKRKRKRR